MAIKQIEGYQIFMGKVLGKGSYGSVYLGKKDGTDEQVAVKILAKDSIDHDQYLKAALKNEIDILQKVHSENVVGFYDVMESSKNYYIIQQLCDGDLAKLIKPKLERPQPEAIQMLRQICNGFLSLVKEGIIHRDLKPANIMTKGNCLKLGDFGFAKQMHDNVSMVTTCVGTPLYMSLQILKGQKYTSKCDIWALGFIFFEILHGYTPWTASTEIQLVKNIEKDKLNIRRNDLSPQTIDFIRRTLELKQQNRISWDEIFSHPIFHGYFLNKASSRQFENKLKMVMNKLRFYISRMNLDMKKIMDSMGFGQHKDQISFQDFYHFLLQVYPEISLQEADYCFKKTDTDNSGMISVTQLKMMLVDNGIKLESQFQNVPLFQKIENGQESFIKISNQASRKIKSCFEKLYKIIIRNNLTLWKVFNDFDKKKGFLKRQEFSLLLKKLCGTTIEISDEEIRLGFDLIDQDKSDSIQFSELNNYYSKINGIPSSVNEPLQNNQQQMIPENGLQFKGSQNKNFNKFRKPQSMVDNYQSQGMQQQNYGQQNYINQQKPGFGNQGYNNQQQNQMNEEPMQIEPSNPINQLIYQNMQGFQNNPGYQAYQPYNQGYQQQPFGSSGYQNYPNPPFGQNNNNYPNNTGNIFPNIHGSYPQPMFSQNNSFRGQPNYPPNNNNLFGQGQSYGGTNASNEFNPFNVLGRHT